MRSYQIHRDTLFSCAHTIPVDVQMNFESLNQIRVGVCRPQRHWHQKILEPSMLTAAIGAFAARLMADIAPASERAAAIRAFATVAAPLDRQKKCGDVFSFGYGFIKII